MIRKIAFIIQMKSHAERISYGTILLHIPALFLGTRQVLFDQNMHMIKTETLWYL